MKKILATLLTLSLLLTASTTAFAYDESTFSGYGQTELTASAISTYTVTIPSTVNLTYGQGEVTVTNADIADGYEIEVVASNLNSNGGIDMTHTTKEGVTTTCYLMTADGTSVTSENPVIVTIKDTQISNGSAYTYFWGELPANAKAGTYTGTMTYNLYCSQY